MKRVRKTIGGQILEGLEEALAFERGEETGATVRTVATTARTAHVPSAPKYQRRSIVNLRHKLGLSQPLFAQALNVSAATVKAWEQGQKEPAGAALRLLELTERNPKWVLFALQDKSAHSD